MNFEKPFAEFEEKRNDFFKNISNASDEDLDTLRIEERNLQEKLYNILTEVEYGYLFTKMEATFIVNEVFEIYCSVLDDEYETLKSKFESMVDMFYNFKYVVIHENKVNK